MDEEKLAEAYNKALELEKSGQVDDAAKAYEKVLEIDPSDHGGAAVRIASMGKAEAPKRAPQAYVATLFDQHANVFDKVLVDDLGYDVPKLAAKMLTEHGISGVARVLDLGCGTGLMGVKLVSERSNIIGVDLSENMLEIAYDRDVYDALYVADVEDYLLDNDENPWNLICAADVLPYLGDLEQFAKGISSNLTSNSHCIFSTETLPHDDFAGQNYTVGKFQRFAHQLDYVENVFREHRLEIHTSKEIIVRHEQGNPIFGHLVLMQKS
ncbi:methyltransferase domain-containing protein [Lentilitoribacter sp. Alg239-R112]|uniref:methyltransferase domain-containing protein n=1 Tax=Lentilitoribacter sp. Alg239-R112 TaxID=2305987 RepID=UPI0013A70601|nr:methyltransferase domain-containing protein [Lentilitoribacter sp. Alg239-R112]